jgi:GT2 family glycosyltransferase
MKRHIKKYCHNTNGLGNVKKTFRSASHRMTNSSAILTPRVWVIIPSFNSIAFTRSCLDDLFKQLYSYIVIVLSDSGSTDGTRELVQEKFPSVIIVSGNPDWWWTKATNEGIKCALTQAAHNDYIMTLNNDVAIPDNYISEMVRLGEEYRGSVIGSAIYDAQDKSRLVECGSYIDWPTMKYRFLTLSDFDQSGFCDELTFLCGKGVLYPVRVFRERGLFDETDLPHYGADQDFIALCKKWGYPIRVQTRVPLYSREDISAIGARESTTFSEKLKLLFIRKSKLNLAVHMRIMLRHCPKRYWLTGCIFLICRLLGHIFVKQGVQHGPVAPTETRAQL